MGAIMRALIIGLSCFLGLLIVGCSSSTSDSNPDQTGACAGVATGSWEGFDPPGTSLALGEDCSYSYTGSDGCKSTGSYAATLGTEGTTTVTITSATAGLCLQAGEYVCIYAYLHSRATEAIAFDCGNGSQSFNR